MSSIDSVLVAIVDKVKAILTTDLLVDEDDPSFPVAGTAYVYPGHPQPEDLQKDLERQLVHVSVFCDAHGERRVPTMRKEWATLTEPDVDLTATLSGPLLQGGDVGVAASGSITFGGAVNAGAMVMFTIGSVTVPYAPVAAATMTAVAAGAAVAINAHAEAGALVTATSVGAVLTITADVTGAEQNNTVLGIALGGQGTVRAALRRQVAQVDIDIWAYDNDSRALFANSIDDGLAEVSVLLDASQTGIRIMYKNSVTSDIEIRHGVYRRVLRYTVEYVRTKTAATYSVLQHQTTVEVQENP